MAGLDMALWDALARLHKVSLAGLLGGVPKPIPAYGAVGYDGAASCAAGAEEWAKRGFTGVKAKIGYATAAQDLEVIRALRKACGKGMAILVDYNQSLTPADAIERLRALDGEGLTWIEEPTLAHDYEGHAQIAREIRTPIQCGENWWGVLDMRHAIAAGASDYMMPDVTKIGGVTGWLRAAAHWLEYADWWNPIVAEPFARGERDGAMRWSDRERGGVGRGGGGEVPGLERAGEIPQQCEEDHRTAQKGQAHGRLDWFVAAWVLVVKGRRQGVAELTDAFGKPIK